MSLALVSRFSKLGASMLSVALAMAASTAFAVIVPVGPHTFNSNLPGVAFTSYNGTAFTTPAITPTATYGVSIDSGLYLQNYPTSTFVIDSGFAVTSSFVFDPTATGTIAPGYSIFSSVGPGTFHISDPFGVILSGSFASATFTSAVGATAGSLSTSNINGLVLTPGPAFTFDTSYVDSLALIPTGFSISLSSIPVGVAVAGPVGLGPFIPVTLLPFDLSSGSVVVSGAMNVVPEPSTMALAGLGAALLLVRVRRARKS